MSPFSTPVRSASHSSVGSANTNQVPQVRAFPQSVGSNFVSAGVLETVGFALGIHDGVQQHMSNVGIDGIPVPSTDTSITIEAMRQLFKEFEGRQQVETNKLVEGILVQIFRL